MQGLFQYLIEIINPYNSITYKVIFTIWKQYAGDENHTEVKCCTAFYV